MADCLGDALSTIPSWSAEGFIWGSAVFAAPGGKFVLDYSALTTAGGRQCITRAVVDGDKFLLFCSANKWDTSDYAIGYAVCDSVSGPCTRPEGTAWMNSTSFAKGPGGQEFFNAGGQVWMVYHGLLPGQVDTWGQRRLCLDEITVTGDVPSRISGRSGPWPNWFSCSVVWRSWGRSWQWWCSCCVAVAVRSLRRDEVGRRRALRSTRLRQPDVRAAHVARVSVMARSESAEPPAAVA